MCAGFVAFGVMSTIALKRKAGRNQALARLAAANGFVYVDTDLFLSTRVPFKIFRNGNRNQVENTMVGQTPDGLPVRLFDLTTWDEKQTKDGTQESRYRYMTCCLTETNHSFPHLVVQPDTIATRLLEKVGMPTIEYESEAFNRRFMVTCEDERFAKMFIDPQMMELLLATEGEFQFEVRGGWMLVAGPLLPAKLCFSLVGLSTRFRQLVPPVIAEYHPDLPPIFGGPLR
jgi:hypothetical protein